MDDGGVSPGMRDAVFGAADSTLLLAVGGDIMAAAGVIADLLAVPGMDAGHLSGMLMRWCAWVRDCVPPRRRPFFCTVGGVLDGATGRAYEVDDAPGDMSAEIWCLRFVAAFLNEDGDQLLALYAVAVEDRPTLSRRLITLLSLCANTIVVKAEGAAGSR